MSKETREPPLSDWLPVKEGAGLRQTRGDTVEHREGGLCRKIGRI